jgi:hypothetical protein
MYRFKNIKFKYLTWLSRGTQNRTVCMHKIIKKYTLDILKKRKSKTRPIINNAFQFCGIFYKEYNYSGKNRSERMIASYLSTSAKKWNNFFEKKEKIVAV